MIRIIPAIKIQGGDGNIIPYMKLGFVIGLNPSIEITANSNEHEVNQSIVSDTVLTKTIKLSKGYSLGFMAALGADFKLNDALSIYGEVGIIGQSYAPTHGEITSSTKNGIDVLGKMTTNQKEVEFVDKYSHSSSTGSSTNQGVPDQTLKTYLPFSSWGLNIGVHYIFGSK